MELDGYSNLTKFATGGMAAVYKARQLSLNRTVAIKFLSAEFLWDDEAKTLFDQESLVIAQLSHPNIIHIIDRGLTQKGRPYFVMEYIQGSDLSQVIQQEKLKISSKINLLIQICKGMDAAHKNGIIHRDIKPSNILVDAESHVHILDFGIACLATRGNAENVVGTPNYMSPEQFTHSKSVTHLSDIYSLGIIMHEMFTGSLPPGNTEKMLTGLANLPPVLARLIEQCLKENPKQRPASADEIRLELLKNDHGAHLNQNQKSEANSVVNNIENKFSLLDIIKKNSFGAVYLFEDRNNHNLLVIKKRVKSFAGFQEAKSLTSIKHPNIINIYGTSKNQNAFIIVMEHLKGGSLQDRLIRKFTTQRFLPIAISICDAMQFAHDHNITHGNLRPSNILFDIKDNIKISDFGLDEHYTDKTTKDWYQPSDKGGATKTRDMYSAGAIFYRMLTGKLVVFANKQIQINEDFKILNKTIQKLLKHMMEEDSKEHYQSFDQLLPDLGKLKFSKSQKPARKPGRLKKWFYFTAITLILSSIILVIDLYFNPQHLAIIKSLFSL